MWPIKKLYRSLQSSRLWGAQTVLSKKSDTSNILKPVRNIFQAWPEVISLPYLHGFLVVPCHEITLQLEMYLLVHLQQVQTIAKSRKRVALPSTWRYQCLVAIAVPITSQDCFLMILDQNNQCRIFSALLCLLNSILKAESYDFKPLIVFFYTPRPSSL